MQKETFRVLIVDNNIKVDIADDIKATKKYFEERTPFNWQFDIVKTNFQNLKHSIYIKNNLNDAQGRDWYGLEGIKTALNQVKVAPHAKYHALMFCYDAGSTQAFRDGKFVAHWAEWNQVLLDTEMIQAVTNPVWIQDDPFRVFTHEILHAMCRRSGRNGRYIADHLDTTFVDGKKVAYYKEFDVFAKDGNRDRTLKGFENKWDFVIKNTIPEIVLKAAANNGVDVWNGKEEEKKEEKLIVFPVKFERAFEQLIKWEGGYVNDPNDAGGETNYGISKRAYPHLDIKNLSKNAAKHIYIEDYWNKAYCDKLPNQIATLVFDMAVNAGVSTAVKMLQKVVGTKKDGIIGAITLRGVARHNNLLFDYTIQRQLYYASLKSFKNFGKGWFNRTLDMYNFASK